MCEKISDQLKNRLIDTGLWLSDQHYSETWRHVYQLGSELQRKFRARFGARNWDAVFAPSGRSLKTHDCIRIIGYGAAITEYMIASLRLPEQESFKAVELGALANFIVTYYDFYQDNSYSGKALAAPVFSAKTSGLGRRARGLLFYLRGQFNPPEKLLNIMVRHYFRFYRSLPYFKSRSEVSKIVNRSIRLMYLAELEMGNDQHKLASQLMRRKNALPFVVMASPAWLLVDQFKKINYFYHLLWSYRMGDFIGKIDDLVDLEYDRRNSQPNQYASVESVENINKIINSVVERGAKIHNSWKHDLDMLEPGPSPSEVERLFPALLRSWVGG